MNIQINEKELVAQAISSHLSPSKLEQIAANILAQRCELVTVKEACRLLKMGHNAVRALGLPVVTLTEKKMRFRRSDIEALIQKRTK